MLLCRSKNGYLHMSFSHQNTKKSLADVQFFPEIQQSNTEIIEIRKNFFPIIRQNTVVYKFNVFTSWVKLEIYKKNYNKFLTNQSFFSFLKK